MFARPCPGIRRSCSSLTPCPFRSSMRRAAASTSPAPPCFQTFVLWGSAVMRTISAPRRPSFSRARCSRRRRRRSCSRDALAPACPSTTVRLPGSQPRHVTVRDMRSQKASSPAASSRPHTAQRSGRRTRRRFLEVESPIPDHRQNPIDSPAIRHGIGSTSISLRGTGNADAVSHERGVPMILPAEDSAPPGDSLAHEHVRTCAFT
jgi:hypothetical protein